MTERFLDAPQKSRSLMIWLVETEIASLSYSNTSLEQAPGQIDRKVLGGFSENYFTKMKISRDPV